MANRGWFAVADDDGRPLRLRDAVDSRAILASFWGATCSTREFQLLQTVQRP